MTPIYCHEYVFTHMDRNKMGLQSVAVVVVTETEERESFQAEGMVRDMLEANANVTHRILLTGYRND